MNALPEIVDTVMAFVGDTSISRRDAGDTTLYEFLVFDPDCWILEGAAVWEGHWRACADTDEQDATGRPCQVCGLCSLHTYVAYVGYIHLTLHREPTYLPYTVRVGDLILENLRFEHREMCSQCSRLLYWSEALPCN